MINEYLHDPPKVMIGDSPAPGIDDLTNDINSAKSAKACSEDR